GPGQPEACAAAAPARRLASDRLAFARSPAPPAAEAGDIPDPFGTAEEQPVEPGGVPDPDVASFPAPALYHPGRKPAAHAATASTPERATAGRFLEAFRGPAHPRRPPAGRTPAGSDRTDRRALPEVLSSRRVLAARPNRPPGAGFDPGPVSLESA